jgi:hypothetical protein
MRRLSLGVWDVPPICRQNSESVHTRGGSRASRRPTPLYDSPMRPDEREALERAVRRATEHVP